MTSISQGAAERLIELQSDIVTTALSEAAEQLQRIAQTGSVRDLAHGQSEVLRAARQRIVDDIARAMTVLKGAAGDVRNVAKRATVVEPAAPRKAVRRRATTKAKTKVRTPARRAVRKAVRRTRRART